MDEKRAGGVDAWAARRRYSVPEVGDGGSLTAAEFARDARGARQENWPRPRTRSNASASSASLPSSASAHHAVGGAQDRGEAEIDEVDVGERKNHVGIEHDSFVQQVVEHVEQRRLLVVREARDLAFRPEPGTG